MCVRCACSPCYPPDFSPWLNTRPRNAPVSSQRSSPTADQSATVQRFRQRGALGRSAAGARAPILGPTSRWWPVECSLWLKTRRSCASDRLLWSPRSGCRAGPGPHRSHSDLEAPHRSTRTWGRGWRRERLDAGCARSSARRGLGLGRQPTPVVAAEPPAAQAPMLVGLSTRIGSPRRSALLGTAQRRSRSAQKSLTARHTTEGLAPVGDPAVRG